MGADGGICWVKIRDRAAFNSLAGWLFDMVENRSAYAYKGEYSGEPGLRPTKGDWLEGAHGTDCDFDLSDMCNMIEWLTSDKPNWCPPCGREDPRDYTFEELKLALLTDPGEPLIRGNSRLSCEWWSEMPVLVESFRFDAVPYDVFGGTLREWGEQLMAAVDIDSYYDEETWT